MVLQNRAPRVAPATSEKHHHYHYLKLPSQTFFVVLRINPNMENIGRLRYHYYDDDRHVSEHVAPVKLNRFSRLPPRLTCGGSALQSLRFTDARHDPKGAHKVVKRFTRVPSRRKQGSHR